MYAKGMVRRREELEKWRREREGRVCGRSGRRIGA